MASDDDSLVHFGVLERVQVPDDNSCLFRSVINCLGGPTHAPVRTVPELRALVAAKIGAEPDVYSEAVLGKPNRTYQTWITGENAWGGAIELSIFASVFQIEFAAVDVKTLRIYRYGEDASYAQRAFLIYDGIHYDSVALRLIGSAPSDPLITQFPASDALAVDKVRELAREFNRRGEYTDTAGFTLKCADCGARLVGEKQAVQHAQATGHANFTES
ncbi:Ubiquitin thioesterase OTU1 [Porphyridium purpureum]|uniref:Ubiquitin thioesterase OTU n=1 Tax=Porphyridium purpureum TaxID=35688 RepID=A0A5J4Z711_PORPP|nr:Ubiquitin thioesterase OTU1 [Porphyridium purpureum]|eukprot:POR0432..scf295_1